MDFITKLVEFIQSMINTIRDLVASIRADNDKN